ncbi:hypothetical protein, partial [Thiohalomonas denitrificans]|uniref:hypothetical protein n=1 Tax=Thiohalomonas denitrificans TaxID=415747 RepID=UPI0026EB74AD
FHGKLLCDSARDWAERELMSPRLSFLPRSGFVQQGTSGDPQPRRSLRRSAAAVTYAGEGQKVGRL